MKDKQKVLEALKLAVSIIENEKEPKFVDNKEIMVGELKDGEYALFEMYSKPMGIMAVAGTSFTPTEEHGYAVNLTNGLGSFSKTTRCRRATREEAFAAALEWD